MGLFTTVIDKDKNYQFKTGDDSCEVFKVGDIVPWRLSSHPGYGHLLDGVYETSEDGKFVSIKGHEIQPIVRAKSWALKNKFAIMPPDKNWWTKKAWKIKAKMDAITNAEVERRVAECRKRAKPGQSELTTAIRAMMSYPIYDQEPDSEWAKLWQELQKEPIPGQNKERA